MTAGRTVQGQRHDWGTPTKYVRAVLDLFGHIDLDPCSGQNSIVPATVTYALPDHDGLIEPWTGHTIYVNPPYGRDPERGTTIKDWLARCAAAHHDNGAEVLALIPVATNTSHWKQHVFGQAAAICFLADTRLRFRIDGSEDNKGCPMATCMVYWGYDVDAFTNVFSPYGTVAPLPRREGAWPNDHRTRRARELPPRAQLYRSNFRMTTSSNTVNDCFLVHDPNRGWALIQLNTGLGARLHDTPGWWTTPKYNDEEDRDTLFNVPADKGAFWWPSLPDLILDPLVHSTATRSAQMAYEAACVALLMLRETDPAAAEGCLLALALAEPKTARRMTGQDLDEVAALVAAWPNREPSNPT